jgi:hypothetical protein
MLYEKEVRKLPRKADYMDLYRELHDLPVNRKLTVNQLVAAIVERKHPCTSSLRTHLDECAKVLLADGFVRRPLVRGIPLERIILDVLHLLLRITDRLFLLFLKAHVIEFPERRAKFIVELQKLGVPFRFWQGEDQGHGKTHWSSLNGGQDRHVLEHLDLSDILADCADVAQVAKITSLWRDFLAIYSDINSDELPLPSVFPPGEDDATAPFSSPGLATLQERILSWLDCFLGDYRVQDIDAGERIMVDGLYGLDMITPYLHMFACHIVRMMDTVGALRRFSCQTLERYNAILKGDYNRCINRGGGYRGLAHGLLSGRVRRRERSRLYV